MKFKNVWDPAAIVVPIHSIKGSGCSPEQFLDMKLNYNIYLNILNRLCLNYADKQEFIRLIIDYYDVSKSKVTRDISDMARKGYIKTNEQKIWMSKKGLLVTKSVKKIMSMNNGKNKNSFSDVETPRIIDMKKSHCLINAWRKGYSIMFRSDGSQDHWKDYRKDRLYVCTDSIVNNKKIRMKAIYLDIYNSSIDKRKSIKMLDNALRKFFENEVDLRLHNIDTEVHLLYYTNTRIHQIQDLLNEKAYEDWIEGNIDNKRILGSIGPEILRDLNIYYEVILCGI